MQGGTDELTDLDTLRGSYQIKFVWSIDYLIYYYIWRINKCLSKLMAQIKEYVLYQATLSIFTKEDISCLNPTKYRIENMKIVLV